MAYGTPTDPVAGTVITVAYAITNILDPIRALRANTGAGDPGALNRVAVSTGVGGPTAWGQVTADAIAAGAVDDTKLLNPKVSIRPPTYATFAAAGPGLSGFFRIFNGFAAISDAPTTAVDWHLIQYRTPDPLYDYRWQLAVDGSQPNDTYTRLIVDSVAQPWQKLWHAGNGGAGSGLDADLLDGNQAAAFALLASSPAFSGALTAASLAASGTVTGTRLISTVAAGTSPLQVASSTMVTGLNVEQLGGQPRSYYESLVASGIPSGLGAWVPSASGIPSGWTRYTAMDGRIAAGAGTTPGMSPSIGFGEGNNGSGWRITPSGSVVIVIQSHSATDTSVNLTHGGSDHVESDHSHGIASQTFTGNNIDWAYPTYAVVWIRKT